MMVSNWKKLSLLLKKYQPAPYIAAVQLSPSPCPWRSLARPCPALWRRSTEPADGGHTPRPWWLPRGTWPGTWWPPAAAPVSCSPPHRGRPWSWPRPRRRQILGGWFQCGPRRTACKVKGTVQDYMIYRRFLIGRDGHLNQSEAYDISYLATAGHHNPPPRPRDRNFTGCILPWSLTFCFTVMVYLSNTVWHVYYRYYNWSQCWSQVGHPLIWSSWHF